MFLDLETIGYFLFMEEAEQAPRRHDARSESVETRTDPAQEVEEEEENSINNKINKLF